MTSRSLGPGSGSGKFGPPGLPHSMQQYGAGSSGRLSVSRPLDGGVGHAGRYGRAVCLDSGDRGLVGVVVVRRAWAGKGTRPGLTGKGRGRSIVPVALPGQLRRFSRFSDARRGGGGDGRSDPASGKRPRLRSASQVSDERRLLRGRNGEF